MLFASSLLYKSAFSVAIVPINSLSNLDAEIANYIAMPAESEVQFEIDPGTYDISTSFSTLGTVTSMTFVASSLVSSLPTDCASLPTITFSSGRFESNSISQINFQGVSLIADGVSRIIDANSALTIQFSYSCIVESSSATTTDSFYYGSNPISFVSSVIIKNIDAPVFVINSASFTWDDSIIYYQGSASSSKPVIFLHGSSATSDCAMNIGSVTASFTGLTVSGISSTYNLLSPIIVAKQLQSVTVQNVQIKDLYSNFNQNPTSFAPNGLTACGSMTANGLFIFENIGSLTIDTWTLLNNSLVSDSSRDTDWAIIRIINANALSFIGDIAIDTLTWTDTGKNIYLPSAFVKIVRGSQFTYPTTDYPKITIDNSQINGYYLRLLSLTNDATALGTLEQLESPNNFTISGIQIKNSAITAFAAIEIELLQIKDGTSFNTEPKSWINFGDLLIESSILTNMRLFHPIVIPRITSSVYTDYSIEAAARADMRFNSFTLTSVNMAPSADTFGQVPLIRIPSFCRAVFVGFSISSCQFTSVQLVAMLDFSEHLLFTSATITSNQFTNSSLVYQAPQKHSASDYHDSFFYTTNSMYNSVRVFFLSNITSSLNTLTNSVLFQSSCPFFLATACSFQETSLDQSILLSGGNYSPLLSMEQSQITVTEDSTMMDLLKTTVDVTPADLTNLLTNMFPDPVLAISPVHYIRFEENTFSATQSIQNSFFISISDYSMANSFIHLYNMTFENLQGQMATTTATNALIYLSNVQYVRADNLRFINLEGSIALLSATDILLSLEYINCIADTFIYSTVSGSAPISLISINKVSYLLAANSTFDAISVPTLMFMISQLIGSSNLIITNTSISNSQGVGFLAVESSSVTNLDFSSNSYTNVTNIALTMISIEIGALATSCTVTNNIFKDCTASLKAGALFDIDAMLVQISSGTGTALLDSNTFRNITITTQQSNAVTTLPGALVKVSQSTSSLTFLGNSMDNIQLLSTMSLIDIMGDSFTVSNLTVSNVESTGSASVLSFKGETATLSTMELKNMHIPASMDSAVLSIQGFSLDPLVDTISIQSCSFQNVSGGSTGILSVRNGNYSLSIQNITFRQSQASGGALIAFSESNFSSFSLSSSLFYNQYTNQTLIQMEGSQGMRTGVILFENNILYEQAGSSANFFIIKTTTNVTITNNSITAYPTNPTATLSTNTVFLYQSGGSITLSQNFNNMNLKGPSFIQFNCASSSPLSTTISNTKASNIAIQNSTSSFISVGGNSMCMVHLLTTGSNFERITSNAGNGSVLRTASNSLFNITIVNSTLTKNSGQVGGAIYSQSTNSLSKIFLNSSKFTENSASLRGGVLYAPLDYTIATDCTLTSNQAYIGGACFFVDILNKTKGNLFNNNTYVGNKVTLNKDPDVSTQAKSFTFRFDEQSMAEYYLKPSVLTNGTIYISNVTSWSLQNVSIEFLVYDYLDQDFYDIDPNNAMRFVTIYPTQNQTIGSYNCSSFGCYSSNNGILYSGDPGTTLTTYVYYISSTTTLENQFIVELRSCVVGEIVNKDLKTCTLCPSEKYSLSLDDLFCKACPTGAVCSGGSSIAPLPNYYRSLIVPDSILPCWEDAERCLGGDGNPCEEGYTGPLCQLCKNEEYYVNLEDGACQQCPDYTRAATVTALGLIGNIVLQILASYVNWRNNQEIYEAISSNRPVDEDAGGFIRQITTYFQVVSILSISSHNLFGGISFIKTISNPVSSLSSYLDCSFLYQGYTAEEILKVRLKFLLGSPFLQLGVIALGLVVIKLIMKKKKKQFSLKNTLITATLTIYLASQPPMLDGLAAYLNCTQLDTNEDATYITTYLNFRCDSDTYSSFGSSFVYPLIIIFNVVVPSVLLLILRLKRKELDKESYRMSLGPIYNDFKKETYYWCIVLVLFKIVMVMIAQLLTVTPMTKSTLLIIAILIYTIIFARRNPYYDPNLRKCEIVAIVTYLAGTLIAMILQANPDPTLEIICQVLLYLDTAIATLFISYFIVRIYYREIKKVIDRCRGRHRKQEQAQGKGQTKVIDLNKPSRWRLGKRAMRQKHVLAQLEEATATSPIKDITHASDVITVTNNNSFVGDRDRSLSDAINDFTPQFGSEWEGHLIGDLRRKAVVKALPREISPKWMLSPGRRKLIKKHMKQDSNMPYDINSSMQSETNELYSQAALLKTETPQQEVKINRNHVMDYSQVIFLYI